MLGGDQGDVVLLGPTDAALEDHGQEDAGHAQDGLQGVVGEFHLVVGPVRGISDGFQGGLADLQQLSPHTALAVEPEIFGIPVAVVHGQRREVPGGDAVDDGVRVLFLHQDPVHPQDEMGAEFAGNAVEVMIGRLVAAELAGLIPVGSVQGAHPGALNGLDGVGQNHGTELPGLFLNLALLQAEFALGHLVGGLVAGPGELDGLLEGGGLVVDEVDGALPVPQDVLGRVGRVPAAQQHGVVILARHVVGLHQGVGSQGRAAVLTEGGDDDRGHREIEGRLIEVVYDA